jgi:uncharacterized NAD(P)/FAD-binding protein YdhS
MPLPLDRWVPKPGEGSRGVHDQPAGCRSDRDHRRRFQRNDGRLSSQRRGCTDSETLHVARVINCTGPARDIRRSASALLRSLIAGGIGRPGPLALGLDVSDSGALVRSDGQTHDRLFAVGPMLKEQLWETTAVRELRTQTADLARRLVDAQGKS